MRGAAPNVLRLMPTDTRQHILDWIEQEELIGPGYDATTLLSGYRPLLLLVALLFDIYARIISQSEQWWAPVCPIDRPE